MRHRAEYAVLVTVAALMACAPGSEEPASNEWLGWRGRAQDGSVRQWTVPENHQPWLEVQWRRPLGPGYSGVSVAGTTAVTMFSDGKQDQVGAFDVTKLSTARRVELR